MSASDGALRGVRVLEFGQYIAGPFLGMLLSDQGAEVIKVERPEGDPAREWPFFSILNRGKASVSLDLKSTDGSTGIRELLHDADVVVENYRPGVASRLGVGYQQMRVFNPEIIYCSLPGYREGSTYRDRQGWDPVIAAQMALHQVSAANTDPRYTSLPYPSMFAAMIGAIAVAASLIRRTRTGLGQRIEVPLHDSLFAAMGRDLVQSFDLKFVDPLTVPQLPMRHIYRCADGRYVQNHGTLPHFVRTFLTAAGHEEWIDDAVAAQEDGVPNTAEANRWLKRFEAIFMQRPALEWEEIISRAGGACCMVRSIDEWISSAHARAVGAVIDVDDPVYGRMTQPGMAVQLSRTPGSVRRGSPTLGNFHGRSWKSPSSVAAPSVRPHFGLEADRKVESYDAPLHGIRVLDLCIILAGPACGRMLAELGADVIKVDDPSRKPGQSAIDVNRGKRSIKLDLKKEEGRSVFWRMLDTSDVVIENYRKGKLDALGLGYEDVKQRKPEVIYGSFNAYGYGGPWSDRPGWESVAQAVSGMQIRAGGRDGRPMGQPFAFNDYGTGLMGAYGVLLALLERARSGRGQAVHTGLAVTASVLQSRFLFDYEGYERQEPEGPAIRGESALSRLYEVKDGWLYLHAEQPEHWPLLTACEDFKRLGRDDRFASSSLRAANNSELEHELEVVLAGNYRDYWIDSLLKVGVIAAPRLHLRDIMEGAEAWQAGLLLKRDHPNIGLVQHTGPVGELVDTPLEVGRPSPLIGADSDEIMLELGYGTSAIEDLKRSGVIGRAGFG